MMKKRIRGRRRRGSSTAQSVVMDLGLSNLRQHMVEFVKKSLEHREQKLYRKPEVRQFWDDEQEEFDSGWAELFFDLLYVAMAFKLGDVIKTEIKNDSFSLLQFMLFFLGQFLPMYEAWYRRTNYLARFVSDSLLHKTVDIFENIIVSFMALFIGTRDQILQGANIDKELGKLSEGNATSSADHRLLAEFWGNERNLAGDEKVPVEINILFCFCIAKVMFSLSYIAKYIELRYMTFTKTSKQKKGVKNMTGFALRQQMLSFVMGTIAAVLAYKQEIEASLLVLISSFLLVGFVMSYVYVHSNSTLPGVPFNVYFLISRFGEFTMLMLGEGVLQIIILAISDSAVSAHLISFGLAFLILNTIEFLKFFMVPDTPERHVLRKSIWRSPFLLLLYPFFFSSLICIGVGLTLVLSETATLNQDKPLNHKITGLLCTSLTFAVLALVFKNTIHLGLYDLIFKTDFNRDPVARRSVAHCKSECNKDGNIRAGRIAFSLFFMFFTLAFLVFIPFDLNGISLLGGCFAILGCLFVLTFLEKHFFEQWDHSRTPQSQSKELDFFSRPAFEREILTMNHLWKSAVRDGNPDGRETFKKALDKKREQLNLMLGFMKAQSNYLQEKIGRTHVERSSLEKVERFLGEVKELRELTELIEENLYFLFSQHTSSLPNIIERKSTGRLPFPKISAKYSSYLSNPVNGSFVEQTSTQSIETQVDDDEDRLSDTAAVIDPEDADEEVFDRDAFKQRLLDQPEVVEVIKEEEEHEVMAEQEEAEEGVADVEAEAEGREGVAATKELVEDESQVNKS